MTTRLRMTFVSILGAAVLTAAPTLAVAQSSGQHQHGTEQGMHGDMTMGESGSMMDCQQMMSKMQEMRAKRQKMDAELDEMVSRMNEAGGEAQQQVMAELLTKLVEQRVKMHDMMSKMQPMMMQHMMGHMKGTESGGMSGCPMMQQMQTDTPSESTPAGDEGHATHH